MANIRDKIAHALANFVLNTIATKEYVERLEFIYVLGINEAEHRLAEEAEFEQSRATLRKGNQ